MVSLYNLKSLIRHLLPGRIRFIQLSKNKSNSLDKSEGYSNNTIFEQSVAAFQATFSSTKFYEQDAVVLEHPKYDFYLITEIYRLSLLKERITIVDFGGGFASKFFQNIKYLEAAKKLNWVVIEQSHVVDFCRNNINEPRLVFKERHDLQLSKVSADIVLISSALQYLDEPYEVLDECLKTEPDTIIIEKTPFIEANYDRQMLQKVPKQIYMAEYKCWFFSINNFRKYFAEKGFFDVEEYDLSLNFYAGEKWKRFILRKDNMINEES